MKKNKTDIKLAYYIIGATVVLAVVLIVMNAVYSRRVESITYNTASDESVEVRTLSQDYIVVPTDTGFDVTSIDATILSCLFVTNDYFNEFKTLVTDEEDVVNLELTVFTNEEDELIYMRYDTEISYTENGEPVENIHPEVTLVKKLTDNTSVICYSEQQLEDAMSCYDNLDFNIK